MRRYFIYLCFDGTAYHGWQIQPNDASVQETLEKALSTLLRVPVQVTGAGRTDAGVHARQMVAHFDSDRVTDTSQLAYKLNRILPRDISIDRVEAVGDDMHARFSARRRTYHYYIHTRKNPFCVGRSAQMTYQLDFGLMNKACEVLLRHNDFAAFCKANADCKTTLCDLYEAHWDEVEPGRWCFTITANRFLRNMVRAVVGTLIDVGRGRVTIDGFRRIVEGGSRSDAGESVPACGLYLWAVEY